MIDRAAYLRSLYNERSNAGLCPKCGHQREDGDEVVCGRCKRRQSDRKQERQGKRPPHESAKWAALDVSMRFACSVCGLRGEHECLEGDATLRPGPGRVFPEGGM